MSGAAILAGLVKAWKVIQAVLAMRKIRRWVRCKTGHHNLEDVPTVVVPTPHGKWAEYWYCEACGAYKVFVVDEERKGS